MRELEKVLKACANSRRLAILLLLQKRREMNVGSISERINLSFRSTSRHLAVLHGAGIVEREQTKLEMFYSLSIPMHKIVERIIEILKVG